MRYPKLGCALLAFLLVGGCWILGPGYRWQTRWFLSELKESTDPEALRHWAIELLDSSEEPYQVFYEGGLGPVREDGTSAKIKAAEFFPKELLSHPDGPNYAYAFRSGSRADDHIEVVWGGGFGRWGLKIGRVEYIPSGTGSYRIKWRNGIYAFYELQ